MLQWELSQMCFCKVYVQRPEASTIITKSYLHMCLTTIETIKILFSSLNQNINIFQDTFNHHDYSNEHVSHSVPMTVPATDDVIS